MRLAIIGGRDFSDEALLSKTISDHFWDDANDCFRFDEIVSGGAKGADSLGAEYARRFNIKLTEYLPNWDLYGKKAGFIRNQDIIANSDWVLAAWDGKSAGTGNSLSIAKRLKKPTLIIYY